MDFQVLPRRDLQALCKRNAIRANMSNAAMAEALRSLQSVEGIDEIRTPGMSAAEERPLPRGGRSPPRKRTAAAGKTEEAAPARDCSQRNTEAPPAVPVDAEPVSTRKRRMRKSRKSKVKKGSDQEAAAAAEEQNDPIVEITEPILVETKSMVGKEQPNGCPLPRGRMTRSRAAAHKTEDAVPAPDTLQSTQKTAAEEAVVPVKVGEISTGKRRTRRSRKSKVKVDLCNKDGEDVVEAACTEQTVGPGPAVVSDKSRNDPKEQSAADEGAPKPQEGEMHCENPSRSSVKRRTRKSRRLKVKMALDKKEEEAAAATKELIADSSDGLIESAVVSDKASNDFKEDKVYVVEERDKNRREGIVDELEPTSAIQKSPSLAIMNGSSIRCVESMAESRGLIIEMAQDASVRGGRSFSELPADEMTFKINPDTKERKDGFILAGEVDQSNLLVNTLDRLVKPMYKFTVKEEKNNGECWWMLM